MDWQDKLTEKEQRWVEVAKKTNEIVGMMKPSSGETSPDLVLSLARSLAASRALVEELRTHIKMDGHGGIAPEKGCHMCHALARPEADFMEAE